jgi:ribosomal protein RSM22 (predicted rRNA methylase)
MIKLKNILNERESDPSYTYVSSVMGDKAAEELDAMVEPWLYRSNPKSAEYFYKNFEKFKKLKSKLPRVFAPKTPNGTLLFRGLKKPSGELKKFLLTAKSNKEKFEKLKIGGDVWYKYKKPIKYTPHLKCQSWTTSKLEATFNFTANQFDSSFQVALCTVQDDSFLFNSDYFSKSYGSDESEIIHVGTEYSKPVYLMVSWENR